jgi:hypothetical protein
MEPNNKKTKKRAKKAVAEDQPAAPVAEKVHTGNYTSWRDDEELVDYEPEEPARFSPMEEGISADGDDLSAPGDGHNNIFSSKNDFPAYLAEGTNVAGRKRSQNVFEEGETSRKASRAGPEASKEYKLSIGVGSPTTGGGGGEYRGNVRSIGVGSPLREGSESLQA